MAKVHATLTVKFPWWTNAFIYIAFIASRVGLPVTGDWVADVVMDHAKVDVK